MCATLAKKWQLKPDQQLAVRNAPSGDFEQLQVALEGVDLTEDVAAENPALLLFVHSPAEVEGLGVEAARHADSETLWWIAYPKASAQRKPDINRDKLWKAMGPSGWRPVRHVGLVADWSAMRFRPADRVGR